MTDPGWPTTDGAPVTGGTAADPIYRATPREEVEAILAEAHARAESELGRPPKVRIVPDQLERDLPEWTREERIDHTVSWILFCDELHGAALDGRMKPSPR